MAAKALWVGFGHAADHLGAKTLSHISRSSQPGLHRGKIYLSFNVRPSMKFMFFRYNLKKTAEYLKENEVKGYGQLTTDQIMDCLQDSAVERLNREFGGRSLSCEAFNNSKTFFLGTPHNKVGCAYTALNDHASTSVERLNDIDAELVDAESIVCTFFVCPT